MDSFKDSLTAGQACQTVSNAISSLLPSAEFIIKPMADGGEGTAKAMIAANDGKWIPKTVTGPLSDMRIKAGFAWFEADRTALVEMAVASGLELLTNQQRNPMKTTTLGTGELISSAIEMGAEKILLAIGGSSTTDGGVGAAAALGFKFLDEKGEEVQPCGGQLLQIETIIPPPLTNTISVKVLCDVDNPLCGKHGAAQVYGPQKGANPEMIEKLDAGLAHLAELVKQQLGSDIKDIPGAGAAGGLGAGAIAFMNATLVSGIQTVMAQSKLAEAIAKADWVITGEGRFDSQSLRGKVISGIAELATKANVPVAVLAGKVDLAANQYRKSGISEAIGCMDEAMSLPFALKNAECLLTEAAKKLAIKCFI